METGSGPGLYQPPAGGWRTDTNTSHDLSLLASQHRPLNIDKFLKSNFKRFFSQYDFYFLRAYIAIEWMIYRTFKGKWVRQPQDNYENELNPCNKVRCIFPCVSL